LGLVRNSIRTLAGSVRSPEVLLIRTIPELRISVSSGISVYFAFANSSNIIALLWFRGISPGRICEDEPAFVEPPIKPAGVALLPAREAIEPKPYILERACAVEDLPTRDSPMINVSK
jgi:hypothetical protein